jgi:hypothetical protein
LLLRSGAEANVAAHVAELDESFAAELAFVRFNLVVDVQVIDQI